MPEKSALPLVEETEKKIKNQGLEELLLLLGDIMGWTGIKIVIGQEKLMS